MKPPDRVLRNALEVYCIPDETLAGLGPREKDEAMKFCVANDVLVARVAAEFGVPVERVREVTACVM